jgi:hypothetical protein
LEAGTDAGPLLGFSADERRQIFHLKTDPPHADSRLRGLREVGTREAADRMPAISAAVQALGFGNDVAPLATGTYHVVHAVCGGDDSPMVVRSTLPDIFTEDRGLLLEGWVSGWLAGRAAGLVPSTLAVRFRTDADVLFDFALTERADGALLGDLGDNVLDCAPGYLHAIGAALRDVHGITGEGAGLIDLSSRQPPPRPIGVHATWGDYVELKLDAHIAACDAAGMIDVALAKRIRSLFACHRPLLNERLMRLLHADPGNHNIVVDPATHRVTALLDWEDALVGDPLFDVAMWLSFHPPRRAAAFLEGYGLAPSRAEARLIASRS